MQFPDKMTAAGGSGTAWRRSTDRGAGERGHKSLTISASIRRL